MLDSNYLIINRHARRFSEMKIAGHTAVFIGSDGKVLDFGALQLGDNVYAALLCEDVRNITFIIDRFTFYFNLRTLFLYGYHKFASLVFFLI